MHIRRTSREQLDAIVRNERAEIWGYQTKLGRSIPVHLRVGEVIAVVIIRDTDPTSGTIEMLSILPEYMGLGLSSALLNHSEYILHKAHKTLVKMKVFIPRTTNLSSYERLGYVILNREPWEEMKDVLKPAAYETWEMLTIGKYI